MIAKCLSDEENADVSAMSEAQSTTGGDTCEHTIDKVAVPR